jgi:hypothetical protein
MKTLTVDDLSFNAELNGNAMAGVRGGIANLYASPQVAPGEPYPLPFNLDEILKSFPNVVLPWTRRSGIDPAVAIL